MHLNIALMGAGAVGCHYGGMLARAGHSVVYALTVCYKRFTFNCESGAPPPVDAPVETKGFSPVSRF